MVVLEDDVVLEDAFAPVVQAIAALGDDWDMVKLMGRPAGEKIRTTRPLTASHRLIQYRRVPSFTAGYVVGHGRAQAARQPGCPWPPDRHRPALLVGKRLAHPRGAAPVVRLT